MTVIGSGFAELNAAAPERRNSDAAAIKLTLKDSSDTLGQSPGDVTCQLSMKSQRTTREWLRQKKKSRPGCMNDTFK